jgi:chromosome partitioning protein
MGVIAIANHKGGVGKTATSLHLGSALGLTGRRVLLLDFDPMGGLTSILNVTPGPNVLAGDVTPMETEMKGVHLLPGGPPLKASEAWLAARPYDTLTHLLHAFEPEYDHVLIDCPPQLDDFTKNAVVAADLTLVPVSCDTQDLVSLTKLLDTIDALRQDYPVCELVVALITKFYNNRYSRDFVAVVEETAPLVLDTPIRHSPVYQQAGGYATSIFSYTPKNSIARKDYTAAAEDVAAILKDRRPPFQVPGSRFQVDPTPDPTWNLEPETLNSPEGIHA